MSSILTNNSAMSALSTLRNINKGLSQTQDRISSGLKVSSAKDNAAYFQISETMKGDSGATKAVNEGLTLTKNSIATARVGATNFKDLAKDFTDRLSFAQGAKGGLGEVEKELDEILKKMAATIEQSTFNGDDMVNASGTAALNAVDTTNGTFTATVTRTTDTRNVVTGTSRASGSFEATTTAVSTVDLTTMLGDFMGLAEDLQTRGEDATNGEAYLKGVLETSEGLLAEATSNATDLGLAEKSIEDQQAFLTKLADNIDAGVGSMVDADMEEEAARLQALQVQQQLSTQALSIANQAPQNILSLFR